LTAVKLNGEQMEMSAEVLSFLDFAKKSLQTRLLYTDLMSQHNQT